MTCRIDGKAAVLLAPLGQDIPGLDKGTLPGGSYAGFHVQGAINMPKHLDYRYASSRKPPGA